METIYDYAETYRLHVSDIEYILVGYPTASFYSWNDYAGSILHIIDLAQYTISFSDGIDVTSWHHENLTRMTNGRLAVWIPLNNGLYKILYVDNYYAP
jgi:hypothetical protein